MNVTLWIVNRNGSETRCVLETRLRGTSSLPVRGTVRLLVNGVPARRRSFANVDELIALSGDWGRLAMASIG